jgi:hypothetical protein
MNDQSKIIDEQGNDALDPRKALSEQTLAVDLARVELDQAIATAHKFPRSIDIVVKKIATLACYNKDAAENCIYALPRGGKPIVGASIGFASIVAQSWGNCRVAAQITYIDRREKVVVAAGRFFDLESNTETIVPVNRRIVDKSGRLYNDDMIQVTGMAAASIGARNAILRGISRGIWHPIWLNALQIVRGTSETFAETKARALAAMAQFGVAPDKIYLFLGLKGEIELTLEHIPTLRGMYTQLRDGSITVEEMFDARRMTGKGFETVNDPLGEQEVGEDTTGSGTAEAVAGASPALAPTDTAAQAQNAPATAPAALKADRLTFGPFSSEPEGGEFMVGFSTQPKAAAEPEQSKAPTNAPEYLAHWRAFCSTAMSDGAIKNQYGAEKQLRKNCFPFTEDQFDEVNRIRDERLIAIQAKK